MKFILTADDYVLGAGDTEAEARAAAERKLLREPGLASEPVSAMRCVDAPIPLRKPRPDGTGKPCANQN